MTAVSQEGSNTGTALEAFERLTQGVTELRIDQGLGVRASARVRVGLRVRIRFRVRVRVRGRGRDRDRGRGRGRGTRVSARVSARGRARGRVRERVRVRARGRGRVRGKVRVRIRIRGSRCGGRTGLGGLGLCSGNNLGVEQEVTRGIKGVQPVHVLTVALWCGLDPLHTRQIVKATQEAATGFIVTATKGATGFTKKGFSSFSAFTLVQNEAHLASILA